MSKTKVDNDVHSKWTTCEHEIKNDDLLCSVYRRGQGREQGGLGAKPPKW